MQFFRRFSPIRAFLDLRQFLIGRHPYELGFLTLAIVVTSVFVFAFLRDANMRPEYHPNIIYVQQWRADRTDAQIRAQQAIDAPIKAKRIAEQDAAQAKRRAEFKHIDDKLKAMGL